MESGRLRKQLSSIGSGHGSLTISRKISRRIYRKYIAATADEPPERIFDLLDPFLPSSGEAIDLGCGAGRGTLRLLSRGLRVTATDVRREGLKVLRSKLPPGAPVEIIRTPFQKMELRSYDAVVASYSLFFLEPSEFAEFWPRLVRSVRPGGIFAGVFLGPHDDWRDRGFTLISRGELEPMFDGFETLYLEEEDKDGETAIGDRKHWHLFHIIARKKAKR